MSEQAAKSNDQKNPKTHRLEAAAAELSFVFALRELIRAEHNRVRSPSSSRDIICSSRALRMVVSEPPSIAQSRVSVG